jgi:hypothetical protein
MKLSYEKPPIPIYSYELKWKRVVLHSRCSGNFTGVEAGAEIFCLAPPPGM